MSDESCNTFEHFHKQAVKRYLQFKSIRNFIAKNIDKIIGWRTISNTFSKKIQLFTVLEISKKMFGVNPYFEEYF